LSGHGNSDRLRGADAGLYRADTITGVQDAGRSQPGEAAAGARCKIRVSEPAGQVGDQVGVCTRNHDVDPAGRTELDGNAVGDRLPSYEVQIGDGRRSATVVWPEGHIATGGGG